MAEEWMGKDYYGFMKGCTSRRAIAVMKILSAQNLKFNVNLCFVDFEILFNRIRWGTLLEILMIGEDWRDIGSWH